VLAKSGYAAAMRFSSGFSSFRRWIVCAFVCAAFVGLANSVSFAHPVAQGSMDVVVSRGSVRISARVSMEEVIVSNTQGSATPPTSTQEAIERHGFYLLNHIVLSADDSPLSGRMVSAVEEESSTRDKALYEFVFDLPAKSSPARIKLSQNVLSEFDFAPGNPWEAFYQVRLGMENSGSIEGLLGGKHPVVFGCTWKAEALPVSNSVPPVKGAEVRSVARTFVIGLCVAGGVTLLLLLLYVRRK